MTTPPLVRCEPDGRSTRVELLVHGSPVSRLWISRHDIRIGTSIVRMDGVGGVGTDRECRMRGYSRRVMKAAVDRMQAGDAALSMLYGIADFYHRFGYAPAGPDHLVILTDLERGSVLPAGWAVRPLRPADLPAVRVLYGMMTQGATGSAVRPADGAVWGQLASAAEAPTEDPCRVVVGPDGRLRAYAWQAHWCWPVSHVLEPGFPDALVVAEAMADGPASADALLAACRQWALEARETRDVRTVLLEMPPEGPLASAAMRQDARFLQQYDSAGGSMARVLSPWRLLEALRAEITPRVRATRVPAPEVLWIRTDMGTAGLGFDADGTVTVLPEPSGPEDTGLAVDLPQTALAQLALGSYPPEDIVERLPRPPARAAAEILVALFPHRHPHMYLPDRY